MPARTAKFEKLFKDLFKPLHGYAFKFIADPDEAKNIIHEVFISLWEKFDDLPADMNYNSYLYTAVRNRCLNHLRDKKKQVPLDNAMHVQAAEEDVVGLSELEMEIALAINSLPVKCRQVFEMNRKDGLKYAEIAEKLGLSVKTVEAQMSKALNVLREHLKIFLSLLLFML